MQADFPAHFLRCPACFRDHTLALHAESSDAHEARSGTLTCSACGTIFELNRGVADLLHDPPEHVRREAAGLARFAGVMRDQGWDQDTILALPDIAEGYWYVQTVMFAQLLERLKLTPGQTLLDIGSNTCWATSQFAERGLNSIALDISTAELQGLYTSDFYFAAGRRYFERIVGTMNAIPIASDSLDYVFCCEVLHHNDLAGLRRTFEEAYRVLKPGGKLLVLNETLKCLRDPHGVNLGDVEQFEGYEHAHWALQYRLGARSAGFRRFEVLDPVYASFYVPWLHPGEIARPDWRIHPLGFLRHWARYNRLSHAATMAWINQAVGGVQFSMIATKP